MADTAIKRTVIEWCLRCGETFEIDADCPWSYDEDDTVQVCPRVCDNGPHERLVLAPGEAVRTGSSLHVGRCPRHNESPHLPLSVACMCGQGPAR